MATAFEPLPAKSGLLTYLCTAGLPDFY
jgi:hypothetical protein